MTDKAKRKSNPRRRLLLKLIFGIGLIVALVSLGFYALRPSSSQIVFIAPDDNGIEQIWLADLNDPEHPRQLTYHSNFFELLILETVSDSHTLFYRLDERGKASEIWRLNIQSETQEKIITCNASDITCGSARVNPNGQYLAYESYKVESNGNFVVGVNVLELNTSEITLIFEVDLGTQHDIHYHPLPQWIGETNSLIFRASGTSEVDEFVFYDVEMNNITNRLSLNILEGSPTFSDDGLRYYISSYFDFGTIPQIFLRHINNPSEFLIYPENLSGNTHLRQAYIQDWHPDNETVMFVEDWSSLTAPKRSLISLYNTATGTKDTIVEISTDNGVLAYESATFNYNGSQILYSRDIDYQRQIMIYDLETGEEIALPLFGRNPQWVNGGR